MLFRSSKYYLKLVLRNTGRFNINGSFIHATNNITQKLATIDFSKYSETKLNQAAKFLFFNSNSLSGSTSLKPGETREEDFNWSENSIGKIYSIELIPIRYQKYNHKTTLVSCGNAKIKQEINCS